MCRRSLSGEGGADGSDGPRIHAFVEETQTAGLLTAETALL